MAGAQAAIPLKTRSLQVTRVVTAALFLGSLSMPFWADSSILREFSEFACLFLMAQMWNLLGGYSGLVSIGQQAYVGVGAYALIILANFAHLNPFLCVAAAGLCAALAAIPVSQVVFRLQGGYFAIGTWAVAEIFRLFVANVSLLGGGSGTSLMALSGYSKWTREALTFWCAVLVVFGSVFLVHRLLCSRFGLALSAIRDSEAAAESQGVDVRLTKFLVYVLSAAGFGVAGALFFLSILRVSPDAAFGVHWSPVIIFMVIIGGVGTIEGPLVGAVFYFALSKLLGDFGTWYLVGLGLLAVLVTIRFPGGLWGFVARRFDLHCFPVERRVRV